MNSDLVFKALADRTRRHLLDALRACNGQSLSDLCKTSRLTRQAVSIHLTCLEKANLVTTLWKGREKLHFINPVPIHQIYARWIRQYETKRLEALQDVKNRAERSS